MLPGDRCLQHPLHAEATPCANLKKRLRTAVGSEASRRRDGVTMNAWRVKMMASWQENMMMMQMVTSMSTNLISFLYRTLKGYRLWIGIAFLLTIVQVASDILIAFPFKFILDKIVSHKNPPLPG